MTVPPTHSVCDGIDPSSKTCVGIAQSAVDALARCESAWDAHFPARGRFSDAKKAEDGRCVGNTCGPTDAAPSGTTPRVHCPGSADARRSETSLR
jgi:hypothetical protein